MGRGFFLSSDFKLSSFLIHFLDKDFPDALWYEKGLRSKSSDLKAPERIEYE